MVLLSSIRNPPPLSLNLVPCTLMTLSDASDLQEWTWNKDMNECRERERENSTDLCFAYLVTTFADRKLCAFTRFLSIRAFSASVSFLPTVSVISRMFHRDVEIVIFTDKPFVWKSVVELRNGPKLHFEFHMQLIDFLQNKYNSI